jgi:hypothetical protein
VGAFGSAGPPGEVGVRYSWGMAWTPARVLGVGIGLLGALHFAVAALLWTMSVTMLGEWGLAFELFWPELVGTALLLPAFIGGTYLAWRRRRPARWVLGISLLIAAGLCTFGIANERYQMRINELGKGCEHYYCTWWWFVGPL